MKEIKDKMLKEISGGSLTSSILDYFRNPGSEDNMQTEEWHSSSTILSPALGRGEQYGTAIVTGFAAIALFAVALADTFFKGRLR
ncbi:bacteriocin [Dryocola sp. BD613]|uniref:bacteriocin n=1 Tax=Dryocola sp. BD613 TaxID=3133272 RepID=UPI003F4FFDEA